MLFQKKECILKVKNVTKQFDLQHGKKLTAVDDVSLELYSGECLGIVGESGCGKSTLANIITNLETLTSGKIIYKNKDISNLSGEELRKNRRKLQMVFQNHSESFNPRMKIGKIVGEPLLNFGVINKSEVNKKVKELLQTVGLKEEFITRYPHQLSGGEKQRVAIARALSLSPEIIICDEATSALDVSIQEQVLKLLVNLQKKKGLSYIFICHDLAVVRNISHRIIVMHLGRIVEIIDSDKLTENSLHPYTKNLLASVFSIKEINKDSTDILDGEVFSDSTTHQGCKFNSRCSKCRDICFEKVPELIQIEKNHLVACHLYSEN